MQAINAIKKLERNGFKVTQDGQRIVGKQEGNRHRIEMLRNGGSLSANIATIRVVTEGDKDEPQSDYCAGVFVDNVSQAMRLAA